MIETNHTRIAKKLEKRGWEKRYIARTLHILKGAEKIKHPKIKKLDKSMFTLFIVLFTVCSTIIFVAAIPVFVGAPSLSIFVISCMGICLGLFSDYLLRHMDIDHRHYSFALFFLPLLTLGLLMLTLNITKSVVQDIGIFVTINPLLIIVFYTLSYSLPHMLHKLTKI
ncbi:MAG: hypothetical protein ABIJ34_05400 [archaeon]